MLRVIEYFSTSLKITQGHWKWHQSIDRIRVPVGVHSNYDPISYHLRDKARYLSKIAIS